MKSVRNNKLARKMFSRYYNKIYTGNRWIFFPGWMGKKEKKLNISFYTHFQKINFLFQVSKLSTIIHVQFTLPILFN